MVKVVIALRRRKDLTLKQFKDYWLTKHAKLERDSIKKDPIIKIVVNFATGEVIGTEELPFDALVELHFKTIEDMRAQFAGKRDDIMFEDEKNFIDHSSPRIFVVTEEVLIGEKTAG